MKYVPSIAAFIFTLVFTTGLLANNFSERPDCQVAQLNQAMQAKLDLSPDQVQGIQNLNETYCSSRNYLLDNPETVGRNTALLACWDKWAQGLSAVLSEAQMQKFMQWQSQVDLLGEKTF